MNGDDQEDPSEILAATIDRQLPVAVDAITTATEELRADREERRSFEQLVRGAIRLGAVLLAVATVAAVASAIGTWNTIEGRNRTRSLIQETADTSRIIRDCTTPEGSCAQAGANRTAAAIAEIIRRGAELQVEIVACSKLESDLDYRSCATDALDRLATGPDDGLS